MRITLSIPLTLNEIFDNAPSVIALNTEATIYSIVTNSKEAEKNDLFIAISGEKEDGETYTEEAKSHGAYILSKKDSNADLVANDTTVALLEIASYFKSKLKNLKTTVAITGSVGKTTTKNVMSKMLSTKYITHATKENYNNFIGLSYTLLSAPRNTEIIVAELGMNHLGEISLMSKILKPDIAVITNVGTSHIGNLGSRELIAKAKLEITDGMINPCLIVPYNEPLLNSIDKKHTFSAEHPDSDYYIEITDKNRFFTEFNIISKNINLKKLRIGLPGTHVIDALCISVAVMDIIRINGKDIENAVSVVDDDCIRGKIIKIDDFYAYDDTYSSSYEAVLCDFEVLKLYTKSDKSCMLGDMLELGIHSDSLHRKLGKAVYEYGFRNLYTLGTYANIIADGALEAGMSKENIFINSDVKKPEITVNQIINNKIKDEIILFKASHNIHAEKIIDLLLNYSLKMKGIKNA
jgi:UDP-N-acetylmuramoyl-tripeptide--D-alanyl-D-alanine ligase